MGPSALVLHLAGFVAPAFFVALAVALGARWVGGGVSGSRWWVQAALNFIAGVLVLAAGLWYFGVDGKMATYAGLVAAIASVQWLGSRAWNA